MENKKERVLAYRLSKSITHDELAEVSGGSSIFCSHMSAGGSAGSGQGGEAHIDVVVDWPIQN